MKIHLSHEELEGAVRDLIRNTGISSEVSEITFSVSRSGGNSVSTEITLSDTPSVKQASATMRSVSNTVPVTEVPRSSEPEATESASSEPEVAETADDASGNSEAEVGKSLFG